MHVRLLEDSQHSEQSWLPFSKTRGLYKTTKVIIFQKTKSVGKIRNCLEKFLVIYCGNGLEGDSVTVIPWKMCIKNKGIQFWEKCPRWVNKLRHYLLLGREKYKQLINALGTQEKEKTTIKKPKPEFSLFPRDKEVQEVESDLLFYVTLFQPELCLRATKRNSALISVNFELDSFLSSVKFHWVYNHINAELSR